MDNNAQTLNNCFHIETTLYDRNDTIEPIELPLKRLSAFRAIKTGSDVTLPPQQNQQQLPNKTQKLSSAHRIPPTDTISCLESKSLISQDNTQELLESNSTPLDFDEFFS